MISALCKFHSKQVLAHDTDKAEGPFVCPECHSEVYLRKGTIRIPHFAHKPPITCSYGSGETNAHRSCKLSIYEDLCKHPGARDVKLEHFLGSIRPDVSAHIHDIPVGIEVQCSALSLDKIIHRTEQYYKKNTYVLWLPQWNEKLDSGKYSPSIWEKWIHAAYYGIIYYWIGGLYVAAYKFEPYYLHVNETHWYSQDGVENQAGGYDRVSKRYKMPRKFGITHIENFFDCDRDAWHSKYFHVPKSKFYIGRGG